MSQPPSPYTPPPQYAPQYYGGYPDALAPARRASVLMFVLGAFVSACGLCMSAFSAMPFDRLPPETAVEFSRLEQELAPTGLSLPALFLGIGIVMFLPGVVLVVLGIFVRRGSLGATVASIMVCALLLLLFAFAIAGAAMNAAKGQGLQPLAVCVWGLPLALIVLLLVWLIQAAKAAPQVEAMRQYQQGYWQHPQQPPYPTGGYTPPPPPPPGAPPGPQS